MEFFNQLHINVKYYFICIIIFIVGLVNNMLICIVKYFIKSTNIHEDLYLYKLL